VLQSLANDTPNDVHLTIIALAKAARLSFYIHNDVADWPRRIAPGRVPQKGKHSIPV
jgi:hypothetical protein